MAITILSNPGSYYSANGDLLFVVFEATKAIDPTTYPDYKYVADIYVGGIQIARLKSYPRPDNKFGIFNIGNIVRNYITAVFNPDAIAFNSQILYDDTFYKDVQVKFGEEYNFTLTTDITVDSTRTYFGHYNGRNLGSNTSLAAYLDKFATTRPRATPVYRNAANNFISYFQPDDANTAVIKSYSEDGTEIGSQSFICNVSGAFGGDDRMKVYNASAAMINSLYPGFITDSIAYFTLKMGAADPYRFDLKCEGRYEVFTLHFLNKFGGFESRDFTKVSRKRLEIERQEYGQLPYTIDASGVTSYFNANKVYNQTRSVYASQYMEKMLLNTDVLTDAEYQWLSDLILSPLIYIEMSSYFIPCVITETNYEYRKAVNDRVTNLTINIEFGDQFNAQYR